MSSMSASPGGSWASYPPPSASPESASSSWVSYWWPAHECLDQAGKPDVALYAPLDRRGHHRGGGRGAALRLAGERTEGRAIRAGAVELLRRTAGAYPDLRDGGPGAGAAGLWHRQGR